MSNSLTSPKALISQFFLVKTWRLTPILKKNWLKIPLKRLATLLRQSGETFKVVSGVSLVSGKGTSPIKSRSLTIGSNLLTLDDSPPKSFLRVLQVEAADKVSRIGRKLKIPAKVSVGSSSKISFSDWLKLLDPLSCDV